MVMQVEHRELYWFGLSVPYVQCESRSLYCLAPECVCGLALCSSVVSVPWMCALAPLL